MTPASPTPASTHTRIKWENLMVALIVVAVVAFAIVGYVVATAPPSSPPSAAETSVEPAPTELDSGMGDAASALTLDDAIGLVEEARLLMREARWDEAGERLASIPEDLFAQSGASAVALELEGSRSRYEQLRAQFDAAVEASQWSDAKQLFGEMAAIAAPNDELLTAMAQVEAGLNPPASPTEPEAVAGGGATGPKEPAASNATKPAAAPKPKPKPSTGTSRPAAPTAPQSGQDTKPSGNGSVNPLAPIELSPEAEAELNAALGFAAGELQ